METRNAHDDNQDNANRAPNTGTWFGPERSWWHGPESFAPTDVNPRAYALTAPR